MKKEFSLEVPSHFYENFFINNTFLGQYKNSFILCNKITKKSFITILKQICKTNHPDNWIPVTKAPSYKFIQWYCRSILLKENKIEPSIIDDAFYLDVLETFCSYKYKFIIEYIDDNEKVIPENLITSICKEVKDLFEKQNGLFTALNNYMDNLLIKIGAKNLFNYFNLKAFEMSSKFDPALLQFFSIDDIDDKEFMKFWMIPTILNDGKISKIFQSLFSCAEPYPASSTFFSEGNILTLINDTICKRKNFSDFILIPCLSFLNEGKVQRIIEFTKEFPLLRALIVVLEYDFLYLSNFDSFKKYVDLFIEDSSIPFLHDIMHRFKNDILFISYIQDSIGIKIEQNDLAKYSFPLLINNYINTIDISSFKDKIMFSISDEDRIKDFIFIFAYKGMYEFLINYKNQKTDNKFVYILDNIKSEKILEDIVMDIYSLLFLKSNDGKNYCSKEFSYHVITLLLNLLPDNKYLLYGLIKYKFVDFINQHNFDFAKTITSKVSKKLYHIAETAEIIYKFENGEPITISNDSNKALVYTEYYLSTNKDLGFMEFLYPEIIAKRKTTKNPLMFTDTKQIHKILSKLNKNIYSNSIDISSFPLLSSFIDLIIKKKNDYHDFSIEDIVKDEPLASFLVMKTVPEEYKNNKIINYIIKGDKKIKFSKDNICKLSDLSILIDQIDKYLLDISDDDFEFLFKKAFTFSPIPTDLLNNLYLRKPEIGFPLYQSQILSLQLSVLRNLDPYQDYNSIKGNNFENKKLDEYFLSLLESKAYYRAKKVAIEFNIMPFLESLITSKTYYEEELVEIGLTFPQLIKFTKNKKSLKQKQNLNSSETNLISEISLIKDIKYDKLCEIISRVKQLPQISNSLMSKIIEISSKFISSFIVNSIETELNLIISFPHIYKNLIYCKFQLNSSENPTYLESFFAQLEQLYKFIQCEFYARYQFQFSFNNFSTQSFGLKLFHIYMKFDRVELINDIKYVWNISEVDFDSIYNCFKLGLLDNGIANLQKICRNHHLSKNQISILYNSLYRILLYPISIDLSTFNIEDKNKQLNIYQDIKNTLQKMISTECGINYYSPNVSAFLESASIIGINHELIQFYLRTAQYDKAFTLFEKVNRPQKLSLFLKLLITPAIAFRSWNTFWLKIQKRIDYFEPIILEFFEFLKKVSMNELAFNLQRKVGYYDHAIISGFIIYQECKSWNSQIKYLQIIKTLIDNSIRISDSLTERKFHNQFLSIDKLINIQVRISLMLSILNVFQKKNEPFDKKLELFSSKENTIYLSSHLLLNLQVGLFFETIELPDITLDEICEYTIEILSKGEGKISAFFKKILCFDINTYEKIVQGLIKEIYHRAVDDKSFIGFVKSNVHGSSIRAKIFMEYGFKSEALQIAQGNQELLNELYFIEGKEK